MNNEPPFYDVECLFLSFKTWITDEKKLEWPVPEENFDALIGEFYIHNDDTKSLGMGFIDGKLVYI